MDARNSQFLQRTATNSSGSLQLKSPVSLGAGDFGLYIWRRLVWRAPCACLGACLLGGVVAGVCPGGLPWERPAFAMAPFGLMGILRLPWHCLVSRAPCVCLGACLLAELWRELAPVGCLRSAPRLPWRRLVWRVSYDCHGAVWSGGCPAIALALLGLASALRLPWHLSAGGVVAGVSPGGCLPRRVSCACLGACLLGGVVRC